MAVRFSTLAVSIALIPAALVACDGNAPTSADGSVRLAVIAGASHGGAPFSTSLTQEVTSTPVWAGDPDGTGTALVTVNLGQREVCWELSVSDVALPATAAHIHRAPPGVRGGIVVFLSAPNAAGTATGCTDGLDAALLRDILQNPEAYYVNVHTTEYPAGAVRGQLPR